MIPAERGESVRFAIHDDPHPYARWNFHPEYELHLILATSGRCVIGDAAGAYAPGQLTLLGPNLPHQWIADREAGQTTPAAHAVLQFGEEWVRACQAAMPELHALDPMLDRSAYGLEFLGDTAARAAEALVAVRDAGSGMARVVAVLGVLQILAAASVEETRTLLAAPSSPSDESAQVAHAVEYVFGHLKTGVRLGDAARRAGMSDSAFSRYFKAASGQTFTDMVRRLRLEEACRLLESGDESIAWIATEVGYANLSNFNRQFLRAHGVTPRAYRRAARSS